MDEALYRLHAEREETYWWWVGKNRIILSLVDRYASFRAPAVTRGPLGPSDLPRPSPPNSDLPTHVPHPPQPKALDIGCGAGGVLAMLAQPPHSFHAVGVDMSPIAREYCTRRGLTALDGCLPNDLPFKEPASFDVIVMSEVIEHVKEDRASVRAVATLLKPGGILICTVPAHMWLWSSHDDFNFHHRRYTRAQFGSLFDKLGLDQVVLSYYQAASLPLVVGARWVEKLRTRLTGRPPAVPEVKPLPGLVNWTLTKAFEAERHILPHMRLPWGTSVISVHRRTIDARPG